MSDPLIVLLVRLSSRYRWTLLASLLLCTAAGLALGASRPRRYEGRLFVQPTVLSPGGPVQQVEGSRAMMQTFLERERPSGAAVMARTWKNAPPAVVDLPLLELSVIAEDEKVIQPLLEAAVQHLREEQDKLYEAELRSLDAQLQSLEQDLERLFLLPLSPKVQEMRSRLILEISETQRKRSPARAHPARILFPPRIKPQRTSDTMIGMTLVGAVLGLFLGYLCVFLLAGARAIKRG